MINDNGTLTENTSIIDSNNRGFNYGDMVFETMRCSIGKPLFWEDHYFRLMASMRILRMEIPMNFTMEFLEAQLVATLQANNLENQTARVKLAVFRNTGGLYTPKDNGVGFVIQASPLDEPFYLFRDEAYEVELFKDYYLAPGLLSTLKTNNRALNVVGSVFAKENNFHNCLLLNTNKNVVEALNGNVFLVNGNTIKTPPLADGCLKGIMRKQVMDLITSSKDYELEEASISPFELQKADELFITNVIGGIQPVSQYRKKVFAHKVAKDLFQKLNVKIRLTS
ncbi:aminotransferase class IV [Hanstruepera neustonica]|uniref:branched-chain-amino-acid transaminase n=1 Tax=Hanstruepera neustonica TaxID=1445657 RepID=A0A2K1DXU8_9FLAO|nr:aminotransferase class IV [Hanstruepera neustonica]PNQ72843.1 aminotransferase class IV [Hanstruepera neustonica]